ncbi:MAG: hypothetical protein A2W91_05655 [Bacteroidetes bacterium GWF2_38_335]|nr:MAG: hypothetical protein A2W91_05655 [Bacteroidetes bacterium GWF2_38_335]HBS88911.1 hypothetical protein [Bacteroidales bacterium]
MKTKTCPKEKWTSIISNFGTGMPRAFSVTVETIDKSPVSGEFIEIPYFWIFKQKPRTGPLKENMVFYRKWINGIYKVKFYPGSDIKISIR